MKNLARCLLAAVFCILGTVPLSAHAGVIISEVAWMGTKVSANAEWIELHNDGSDAVLLDGWKLEASDGSPKINLAGSILAGGYFLIERTSDASVPDEQADLLFTGALGNTGETLVLKDQNGNEAYRLEAAAWPAGDNDTKDTMQWNGTEWITAEPTPKAENKLAGTKPDDGGSGQSATTTPPASAPSAHSSDEPLSTKRIAKLTLDAGRDRLVSVGAETEFEAQARDNGSEVSGALYVWSFGDGGMEKGKRVTYEYAHPGTYVVVVNASKGGLKAVMRFEVTVAESRITISSVGDGYVELENGSEYETNLQGWELEAGSDEFAFPDDTIILPGAKIRFARSVTGISGTDVKLVAPDGEKMHASKDKPENATSSPVASSEALGELEAIIEDEPVALQPVLPAALRQLPDTAAQKSAEALQKNAAPHEPEPLDENAGQAASVVQIYRSGQSESFADRLLGRIRSWWKK